LDNFLSELNLSKKELLYIKNMSLLELNMYSKEDEENPLHAERIELLKEVCEKVCEALEKLDLKK
jgi:hypothetical protein